MLKTTLISEDISTAENPVYEEIISDIATKGFSIVENFFDADTVALLRDALLLKHEANRFKKAAIGNRVNETIEKTIRGDVILWIDEQNTNATENLFFAKVNDFITYLNRTCFMGILHKEFHYALYPKGTFYKRHIDTFHNDDRRKLSIVCYLNDENWEPENGGELVLYLTDNGRAYQEVIYPFPGRVVIFESQKIEHEVKAVNTERLSITGWLKTR